MANNANILDDELQWASCRFSDKFERVTRKNKEKNGNVLTISAQQGLINQFEYYNQQYASEDTSGYTLIRRGEFAYNKSYSDGYSWGALKRLERYDSGVVSPLYICFSPKAGVCSDFYKQYFEAGMFNREIYKIAQEGARNHGLLNISTEDFFKASLANPPLAEQKKIAEILGCCDEMIRLKKALITEKKKQKKALMQKLLEPSSGFRLPGFSGKWKQASISEIADLLIGYPFESDNFSTEGIKLLRCSNIKRGELDWTPTITEYWPMALGLDIYLLQADDIVIAMDGALVGYSFALIRQHDLPLLLVQRVARLRAKGVLPYFLKYLIMNPVFGSYADAVKTTTAIPHISPRDILTFKVNIPKDKKEQQAIADILSAADREIDLLTQELEQQEKKKKSLMQLLLTGIIRV